MFTGEEIRLHRKRLGLSAERLADLLGTSKDNIYKWEKGHRPQSGEDYQKVENWLGEKLENIPHGTKEQDIDTREGVLKMLDKALDANLRHATANEKNAAASQETAANLTRLINELVAKLNLGESGQASLPAGDKTLVRSGPMEQTQAFVGKSRIVVDSKNRKKKDIVSEKGN